MKIGLFGGSFNPIHIGHVSLARQLAEAASLDEVWLLVSPQNPLKPAGSLLADNLRLEMVQKAVENEALLKASDYEFHLPRPSYTWQTLQGLSHDYPEHRFTLLIGGDNWQVFDRWYHHEDILNNYSIVIYPRPGYPIDSQKLPPQVTLVHAQLMDVSSTDIRRRIAQGEDFSALVPATVNEIIVSKKLYR